MKVFRRGRFTTLDEVRGRIDVGTTMNRTDGAVINELDKLALFQDVTVQQLGDIVGFCTRLALNDGDILIHEHEKQQFDLYVLCKGSVEVVSNNSPFVSGECVLSREHKDLFGEISWLSGHKRTATVRCHGEVEAVRIDGEALWQYLTDHPDVGFVVMRSVAKMMADRMAQTDGLLKQILWSTGI